MYPYPFLGVSYNRSVTLDDILAMNFDQNSATTQTKKASKIGSRSNNDIELGQEEIKIDTIVKESQDKTQYTTYEHLTDTPQTSEISTTPNDAGSCKVNGAKVCRWYPFR